MGKNGIGYAKNRKSAWLYQGARVQMVIYKVREERGDQIRDLVGAYGKPLGLLPSD